MFLYPGRQNSRKDNPIWTARAAFEKTAKRLRGRERQLVFLSGALECFRRVLDPINDLIISLDWHQANYLVLAARNVVRERPFEINKLTDWIFMHHWPVDSRQFGAKSRQYALTWSDVVATSLVEPSSRTLAPWLGKIQRLENCRKSSSGILPNRPPHVTPRLRWQSSPPKRRRTSSMQVWLWVGVIAVAFLFFVVLFGRDWRN